MFKYLLVILFILFSTSLSFADDAADKAEFKRLYAEFNDLYASSEEIDPIIEVAEKVREVALKAYGKNHMNTAVVTYNLASLYDEKGKDYSNKFEEKAVDLYQVYFRILEKMDKPFDQSYLSQYLNYITAYVNVKTITSWAGHIDKLDKIIDGFNITNMQRANTKLYMGSLYSKASSLSKSYKNMQEAIELYEEEQGKDFTNIGQALFFQAKIDMFKKKRDAAEEKFLRVLDIYSKNGLPGHEVALSTHAFLVNLYEDMGYSDKATEHCRAVAVERPTDFDVYVEPIYRSKAEFPDSLSRIGKGGWALLQFVVDENGITRDIEVLDSSHKGFEKTSIKAISKYRYAPSVKNGKLVTTKGVRIKMEYQIAN